MPPYTPHTWVGTIMMIMVNSAKQAHADPTVTMEGVVDLTAQNFDEHVGVPGGKAAFVEFYAPWCGHCITMAYDWEKIGFAAKDHKDVVIGKVDADKHKSLFNRFGLEGFPVIKFFPSHRSSDVKLVHEEYGGERNAEAFAVFLNRKLKTKDIKIVTPPSQVVHLTGSNFDSIVHDTTKHVFVEIFSPSCGFCKQLAPKYEAVAKAFRAEEEVMIADLNGYKYDSEEIMKRHDVKGFPLLLWFPKEDKNGQTYRGAREVVSMVDFVNTQARVSRTTGGKVGSKAGTRLALNLLASEYWNSQSDEDKALLDYAVKEAGVEKYGFYSEIATSIDEHGREWVASEKERIQDVLVGNRKAKEGDRIDESEVEALSIKLNQLNNFKSVYNLEH